MLLIHNYLDSRHSTAVRLRNAAILLALVMVVDGLLFWVGVKGVAALVHAGIIDVPTAINIGLISVAAWSWFLFRQIPYVRVPRFRHATYPLLVLSILSAVPISFASFISGIPTTPPRYVSIAN